MIAFKAAVLCFVLALSVDAACNVVEYPVDLADCLGRISSGLVGLATRDTRKICKMGTDLADCIQKEIRECLFAEIGVKALDEIMNLTKNCCPDPNKPACPIRDEVLKEQRCFAADSMVTLVDGQHKSLLQLTPSDTVLAFDDTTKTVLPTRVITMLDKEPNKFALFKQMTTTTGRRLSLTSSHLLRTVSHGYVMAKNMRVGMDVYVLSEKGVLTVDTITDIREVIKQGYVAPLTEQGTIIVDGLAASCYATIDSHHLAHGVLAPMRWWYWLFGSVGQSTEASIGVHWFPQMLYELTSLLMPSIIHF